MSAKIIIITITNLFYLILFINQIILSSQDLACKITVPDTVISQKLDNIICIGPTNFAYSNFATFSDGSLIVESSEDQGTVQRAFYGITKDGKPFFVNNEYHMSLNANEECFRKDSENGSEGNFITRFLNNISKASDGANGAVAAGLLRADSALCVRYRRVFEAGPSAGQIHFV